MKNILLFGGTFDPPHIGHLLMAQLALEQTTADEVWFLPAPAPPHKSEEQHLSYSLRVQLVEALIRGYREMRLCEIESTLPKPSYSADTVRACLDKYPDCRFQFLLGSDSLASLPSWHEADVLAELIEFVVAVRTGFPFEETFAVVSSQLPELRASVIEMPVVDVSSTFLRDRLTLGQPICGLLPEAVHRLWVEYREPSS